MTKKQKAMAVRERAALLFSMHSGIRVRVDNATIPAEMGTKEAETDPPFMVVIEHPVDLKLDLPDDFGGDVEVRGQPYQP